MIVYNAVSDGGGVLLTPDAVTGVQCEQEGAEHAALGGSSVEH